MCGNFGTLNCKIVFIRHRTSKFANNSMDDNPCIFTVIHII